MKFITGTLLGALGATTIILTPHKVASSVADFYTFVAGLVRGL